MPHDVELTKAQLTQLVKNAAICGAYCVIYAADAKTAATGHRIIKTLKLDSSTRTE